MKHSYNMIHAIFGHSIPSYQINHILVLMLLDVERSHNVEIWINWILCINWIAQVPHEPRSSAMPNWTWSSPSLLLPGGLTESGRFLCDVTHVIIINLREKKQTEKFIEIYGNLPKLLQSLNNWKVWKPFYLLKHEISYPRSMCAIDPSPQGWVDCHLSPSLSRHGRRCCHRGLLADTAMGGERMAITAQVFPLLFHPWS